MSYRDFLSNFTKLEMCMMTPVRETITRDHVWQSGHVWKVTIHDGSWQRQVNAGGCRNYLGTVYDPVVTRHHCVSHGRVIDGQIRFGVGKLAYFSVCHKRTKTEIDEDNLPRQALYWN